MNYNSFAEGIWIQFQDTKGPIKFVCHNYITVCINPENHKARQTNRIIFSEDWPKVALFKESEK